MVNNIHGHEVMRMMVSSNKVYTRASLRNDIIEKFGEDTRFYTCSAENMTADQLIDFLNMKDKFHSEGDGFTTDSDKICNH